MTNEDSEHDDAPSCPGPHHMCRGCGGAGMESGMVLHVNRSGVASEMPASHVCTSCQGRGFFCKAAPTCSGGYSPRTPSLHPHALPPV